MVERTKITHTCPSCGKVLMEVKDEEVLFRNCEHHEWSTSLGSIANDQLTIEGKVILRLWRR